MYSFFVNIFAKKELKKRGWGKSKKHHFLQRENDVFLICY